MNFAMLERFLALKALLGNILVPSSSEVPADAAPKTGWQKFIDGLNAAGRPILLMGITALTVLAYVDPTGFSAFALALSKLPEMAWYTIFAVITAYVTATGLADVRRSGSAPMTPTTVEELEEVLAPREGRFDNLEEDHPALNTPPAGNASIAEWKAQNEAK